MKNCKFCGKEIEEDSLFCRHCGKQVYISTEVTDEDLANAVADEYDVLYSRDGRRLLKCENCSITEYTVREGTKVICDSAFWGCTSLKAVTIPNCVIKIGSGAFYHCSGVTQITIPEGVTKIGECAFQDCMGLKSVTIGNGVTAIGDFAFAACTGLTHVTLGSALSWISEGTFYYCKRLKEVIIPNGIKVIGEFAFADCVGLTKITLPESVTGFCDGIFKGCTRLESITSLNPGPPSHMYYSKNVPPFLGVDTSTCIVYVPHGSRNAYASHYNWWDFMNIMEIKNK